MSVYSKDNVITFDFINHPPHYTFSELEVIDVIEDWKLNFHIGNAVKYIARAGKKGSYILDVKKSKWYLNRCLTKNIDFIPPNKIENKKYEIDYVLEKWNLDDELSEILRLIYNGYIQNAINFIEDKFETE